VSGQAYTAAVLPQAGPGSRARAPRLARPLGVAALCLLGLVVVWLVAEPLLMTFWGLALVSFAIARRRGREALAVAIVFVAAPLCADFLKPLLAHSHDRAGFARIGDASWPSGHATAAMTLVLCAALVAPRRMRALVAIIGAVFALAVGCALLIRAWHMPSDVIGGYLLAGLWMALAVAGLRASERRWPRPHLREA
jgi:membrane-associated phospholipid phosphatase